jgi:hypothetical protein
MGIRARFSVGIPVLNPPPLFQLVTSNQRFPQPSRGVVGELNTTRG